MVDAAVQRHNMVESQIRPSDVSDRRIVRAMQQVPREKFVPEHIRSLAYIDNNLQLSSASPGAPRFLLAPRVLAKLVHLAALQDNDVVLDVGCATGYSSAVLSRIAETVVALEEDGALGDQASRTLTELSLDNVVVVTGKLAKGYPGAGPYDVIVVEGGMSEAPASLFVQLKDGGRLVGVIGDERIGKAWCWMKIGQSVSAQSGFDAVCPILPGFDATPDFAF